MATPGTSKNRSAHPSYIDASIVVERKPQAKIRHKACHSPPRYTPAYRLSATDGSAAPSALYFHRLQNMYTGSSQPLSLFGVLSVWLSAFDRCGALCERHKQQRLVFIGDVRGCNAVEISGRPRRLPLASSILQVVASCYPFS